MSGANEKGGVLRGKKFPLQDRATAMGIHDEHRDRMRDRIRANGIDTLQDHEVLEYILYHFIPRRNTNDIAHDLIKTFGSFADVLNADEEHLRAIKGMTANAALFLVQAPECFRRYLLAQEKNRESVKGRGTTKSYLQHRLFACKTEEVHAAALDAQDAVIKFERMGKGSGNSVSLSVREIVAFALRTGACGIILAHNHPSGNLAASQSDLELTRELLFTLESIGVVLQDHYIFCGNQSCSMEENGVIATIRGEKEKLLKEGIGYYE